LKRLLNAKLANRARPRLKIILIFMKKNQEKIKQTKKIRRQARVRANIFGSASRPRLSVNRSLKHISAQLIDDENSKTLASASDRAMTGQKKLDRATEVGKNLAALALKLNIKKCIFDRGSYKYHGRVKALADGARAGGLEF